MKYIILFLAAGFMVPAVSEAQDEAANAPADDGTPTEAPEATPSEETPADEDASEEDERGVYSRKVKGLLWLEALFGVSSYDPDQFGTLDISGGSPADAPRLKGPEFGGAVGLGLGGFWIGAVYRQANYDQYKLGKVGLDIQGVFRFIPFVHPMVRIDLFYATIFDGNPYGGGQLTNVDADGGGFTLGAGLRIPIIRWISFAATVDWSFIAMAVRGDDPGGTRQKAGISGQQIGATFALTFHFIGVRRD